MIWIAVGLAIALAVGLAAAWLLRHMAHQWDDDAYDWSEDE